MSIEITPSAQETRRHVWLTASRAVQVVELTALAGVVVYFCTAAALISLFPPGNDEAEYASPAVTLLEAGKFAAGMYEPKGGMVPGRDEVVYYMLPGHPIASVPLIALFGPSLTALRWKGLILMSAAAFLIFKILELAGLPRPYPALATALMCLNRNWVHASVTSRPEPQAFFLGLAGAYLFATRARDRKPLGAALGGLLIGLAVTSHLNAIMFGFCCLAIAAWEIRKDFKNASLYAGAVGVLLGLVPYVVFTQRHPNEFHAQIGWNSNVWGRVDTWSHPIAGLWRELSRWAPFYRTFGGTTQQVAYVIINAISLGAIVFLALRRRGPQPLRTIAPLYAVAAYLTFALFNNVPMGHYFFYRTFIADICIVALLAVFSTARARAFWGVAVAFVFLFHFSRDLIFLRNAYADGRDFDSFKHTALNSVKETDLVMGTPELAFMFGYAPNYKVDDNFGFYSGRRPDFVIIYQNRLNRTLVSSAFGGTCVGDTAGAEQYFTLAGPAFAAQVKRDSDRLCPYLRELTASAKSVYRDEHYELLRIEHPGS